MGKVFVTSRKNVASFVNYEPQRSLGTVNPEVIEKWLNSPPKKQSEV